MRVTIITFIIILLCNSVWAILPAPPVVKDIEIQQYLKSIYDNHNVIKIVSSSPNGARVGSTGEIVIVSGATIKLWVNQGGTSWASL